MYRNFGDRNFFEYGVLVDDHESTDKVFDMLLCRPYSDREDLFQFARVAVNTEDSWIDRAAVMSFAGMTEEDYNSLNFAIACTDYYSWDNFGACGYDCDWQHMTEQDIRNWLEPLLQDNAIDLSALELSR